MTQPVPSDASVRPPIRTCVGCRTRDERRNLLRIVSVQPASDEAGTPRYLPDTAGTMPGRGAWIHPSEACVAALEKKNGLARAFKRAVPARRVEGLLRADSSRPDGARVLARSRTRHRIAPVSQRV